MLPSMFILQQQQHLHKIAGLVGFQGEYSHGDSQSSDLWEWLNETVEGFGKEWWSNWMETWASICETYVVMQEKE